MYIWLYKRRKQNNGSLINQICFGGILNACTVKLENNTFLQSQKIQIFLSKKQRRTFKNLHTQKAKFVFIKTFCNLHQKGNHFENTYSIVI